MARPTDQQRVWLLRAGKNGERDRFAIDHGFAGGGWHEIPDLTPAEDFDAVRKIAAMAFEGNARIGNAAGQLSALRNGVQQGDFIVLPLKTTRQIAIGLATGGYIYRDDPDPTLRHVVPVEWERTDVPRTAIKKDLLYSLGSALSFCEITRNNAVERIAAIVKTGSDPGMTPSSEVALAESSNADDDSGSVDLAEVARDQIRARIVEDFDGFGLEKLVGKVLEARGFHVDYSTPGGDGGVDLLAGSGVLGLDSPRIVVQVKKGDSPVDATVTRGLQGVMTSYNADQALLVAWGGLNSTARTELQNQFFQFRVWDAENLLDELLDVYELLDEDVRNELRLKPIWIVDDGE